MSKSYVLLEGALDHLVTPLDVTIGDTVYKCQKYDYGIASDDTQGFGESFISVTLDKDGGYPFFTVPVRCLENINDNE